MDVRELSIAGAVEFTSARHADHRGSVREWYSEPAFTAAVGRSLTVAQSNHTVSVRGGLRGVHFADVPPGQAKYVYCPLGAVLDVVVDLRVGSPTFGQHEAVRLDPVSGRALYVAEGLGHAMFALADDSLLMYLMSTGYAPDREHTVDPLDPALGLPWPEDIAPVLSDRDRSAPSLAEAQAAGLLPDHEACQRAYRRRR